MELKFAKSAQGEYVRYSAFISGEKVKQREVFLEIPAALEPMVGDRYANSLTLLAVFDCMKIGGEVHVASPLEADLVANLEELSRVWALWLPDRYKWITFKAETYKYNPDSEPQRPDVSAFSGGVDACYVIAHSLTPGTQPVVHVGGSILIHGADIPLHDTKRVHGTAETFKKVLDECTETLKEYNIPLHAVRTNIREVNPNWGDIFFCVVVASMRLFSKAYGRGVLGTDQTCDLGMLSFPWGENPITNRLYSTPEFGVVPLGLTLGRTGRCSLVAEFPTMLKRLRVCYQSNACGGNCGVCEKCVRTKLNLIACGKGDVMPFREPFEVRQIRKLKPSDRFHAGYFGEILAWDEKHGRHFTPEVISAVKRYVKRSYAGGLAKDCAKARPLLPVTEKVLTFFFHVTLSTIKSVRRLFRF